MHRVYLLNSLKMPLKPVIQKYSTEILKIHYTNSTSFSRCLNRKMRIYRCCGVFSVDDLPHSPYSYFEIPEMCSNGSRTPAGCFDSDFAEDSWVYDGKLILFIPYIILNLVASFLRLNAHSRKLQKDITFSNLAVNLSDQVERDLRCFNDSCLSDKGSQDYELF